MVARTVIDDFLTQRTLALAGVSRTGKRFGHAVYEDLTRKGYRVLLIHPEVDEIGGVPCYRSIADLPARVDGLVLVVPPQQSEILVKEAHEAGIRRVWMQQGAESEDAIRYCEDHGMDVVHGQCIMMFADPKGVHKLHHWVRDLFGKLPADSG